MGTPIAYGLSKLGFEVLLHDTSKPTLEAAVRKLEDLGILAKSYRHFPIEEKPDIVVSAVPWKYTFEIAAICSSQGLRYCDLGGNPSVSSQIHKNAKAPVFTDLGLAPGWANIIAEKGYREKGTAEVVNIYVGGLPQKPNGRLKYNRVFSLDGLVNEYTGFCDTISKGKIKQVRALSEISSYVLGDTRLEAAHTKGGLATTLDLMSKRGVKECSYKTLRYLGHFDYVDFLMNDCALQNIETLCKGYTALEVCFLNACDVTTKDLVIIGVHVDDWCEQKKIMATDDWTAMQMTTAFPTAAMAAIMASGELDHKIVLDYSDVPIDKFEENLRSIDETLL